MSHVIIKKILNPLLLIVVSLLVRGHVAGLDVQYQQLLEFAPYALLGVLMILCLNYNRSRLFVLCLSLFLVYYLIQSQLQVSLTDPKALAVFSMLSILQPVFLLQLMYMPDRGLLNRYGALLVFSLVSMFLAGLLSIKLGQPDLNIFLENWFSLRPFPGVIVSTLSMLLYLAVCVFALRRLYRSNDDFALVTLSVSLFSLVTLAKFDLSHISMVMFIGLGVSLILGMMGTSYNMAYRDELTGLLGRRALNDRMKGLAGRYVMAMMDVDHFKKFNDTHGHDIGDEVLKMVASQIDMVGGGGTAYRYGGEEFCIVFNGKDIEYCRDYLEDVRINIEEYQMKVRDKSHRAKTKEEAEKRRGRRSKRNNEKIVAVTISIGVAEPTDTHRSAEDVIKQADKALYRAKKKGRNCLST